MATDWDAVDWHRGNREIAAALGVSHWTVLARRKKHAPETVGKYRSPLPDVAERRSRLAAVRNIDNTSATEAAKTSPRAGRHPDNANAKEWRLVAPDGSIYTVRNLHHFIREHADLFDADAVAWRRTSGKRGGGGEYCKASAGLQNIKAGKSSEWRGWMLLN